MIVGAPSLMPKREILTSQQGDDGLWHVHYPTGTKTLCGRDLLPYTPGGKLEPDCGVCSKVARAWDRIDPCMPDRWRPDYPAAA